MNMQNQCSKRKLKKNKVFNEFYVKNVWEYYFVLLICYKMLCWEISKNFITVLK